MNSLRRSVRMCAVVNRNDVISRSMSSSVKGMIEVLEMRKKSISNFDTVTQNTIHRMNCVKDMGKLLYPGSLSTVPKRREDYLENSTVELQKLIDFDCSEAKNQLTIMSMRCPTLLLNELKRACHMAEQLDLYIIQLSYENYEDTEQGRKDCLLAANEIVIRLSALSRWAYFSAVSAPIKPDDEYFFLFKSKITDIRKEFAANLHAQVTTKDGCVKISFEPFDKTVGVIYTNVCDTLDILRLISAFEIRDIKKGDKPPSSSNNTKFS